MNEYFCSAIKDLAGKIELAQMLIGIYNLNPDKKGFNFKPVAVQHNRDAMDEIKSSKSIGSDNKYY